MLPKLALASLTVSLALAPTAQGATFEWIKGYNEPATPAKYDKVGILKVGKKNAKNVLVLNPGTSASSAYFHPLMKTIVKAKKDWQVWAVERRENLLEDHSAANGAKGGAIDAKSMYDYYLGHIGHPEVTDHIEFIPDADVQFAKQWGMRTEIEDLHRVVKLAKKGGRTVVLGGHSLGGTITTAYATWDFGGKAGANGLSGLVFIDGGSGPEAATKKQAQESLDALEEQASPWLVFGGIPAPFAGLFNIVAAQLVKMEPDAPSRLDDFDALPANLRPPVPTTTEGGYGYALDTATSPDGLVAAQAHLGKLSETANADGLHAWEAADELTPIQRYAEMFAGTGLPNLDGTAWYHPQRLTIDGRAVAAGNKNPAQKVMDVHAIHGDDLPEDMLIYAFGASLGGKRVVDAAKSLAKQSDIPRKNLTLVNKASTYSHNDPNSAFPKNAFVQSLLPYLEQQN